MRFKEGIPMIPMQFQLRLQYSNNSIYFRLNLLGMLEQKKKEVFVAYQQLKKNEELSVNLLHPTTAKLRKVCATVFHNRPDDKIKSILQSFDKIGFEIKSAEDIHALDADKFKPLLNFMNGEIANPNPQNVELLAWLIDEKESETIGGIGAASWLTKGRRVAVSIALIILSGIGVYYYVNWKKCMYWDGTAYQKISCNEGANTGLRIIKLDKDRLARFRRITKIDTINYKDIGRVWYMKIAGEHEFYTAKGMHPVEEKKQLKPITKFIIDEHIIKVKDSVN